MEDFGAEIDMDWEFDAPHWYDFRAEETENPDVWFDEQEAKMAKIASDLVHGASMHLSRSKFSATTIPTETMKSEAPKPRKPTRIPVASRCSTRTSLRRSLRQKSTSDIPSSKISAIPVSRQTKKTEPVPIEQEVFGEQLIDDITKHASRTNASQGLSRVRSAAGFAVAEKQSRVPLQERVNRLHN